MKSADYATTRRPSVCQSHEPRQLYRFHLQVILYEYFSNRFWKTRDLEVDCWRMLHAFESPLQRHKITSQCSVHSYVWQLTMYILVLQCTILYKTCNDTQTRKSPEWKADRVTDGDSKDRNCDEWWRDVCKMTWTRSRVNRRMMVIWSRERQQQQQQQHRCTRSAPLQIMDK